MAADPPPRAGSGHGARTKLLDTAEALIADVGLGAVSLRQIGREAGQRNTGAVRYHFGTLDDLVDAILARHLPSLDTTRNALLDQLELDGGGALRGYAAALVQPLGSAMATRSGRHFLALAAQLVNHPSQRGVERLAPEGGSLLRWRAAVEPLLPEGAVELHSRFNAIHFAHTEMARRAARPSSERIRLLITSRTADLVAAVLATPLTEPTRRLLERSTDEDSEPLAGTTGPARSAPTRRPTRSRRAPG